MGSNALLETLLKSDEPSVQWKTRVEVLGESPDSPRVTSLRKEIARSPRANALLRRKDHLGRPGTVRGVYYKWQGCHWVLARLADLGYPTGDPALYPLRDRVLGLWLRTSFFREFDATTKASAYRKQGVPRMEGRYRRCASQQGNALYAITRLGLDDGRGRELVERLLHWQWPDGGWNCDRDPSADTSSFLETLLPMRGLEAYGRTTGLRSASRAARRASEVFLRRRLFRRVADGTVIKPEFVKLHYPAYYYYDVLAGLRGLLDVGRLGDPRCEEALDLLENKRLPDGGWPAEAKFYRYVPDRFVARGEYVDWGGASPHRMNPWVTVEAMSVLVAAGRLKL